MINKKTFLTIAATDTSGGAGIQQDLKAAQYYDFWGLSVVTANTAQTLNKVIALENISLDFFEKQLDTVFNNFKIDCIKLGVIPHLEMLELLSKYLKSYHGIVILDPVLISSSGFMFSSEEYTKLLKELIVPQISVLTPNREELETLTGINSEDYNSGKNLAREFCHNYHCSVYLKGGHFPGNPIKEAFINIDSELEFTFPRFNWKYSHGTGCAFSSALAINLIIHNQINLAIEQASAYVRQYYESLNNTI